MKKIAIIYDLDEWILGTIAREMMTFLSGKLSYQLSPIPDPNNIESFISIQQEYDALHFLSPWVFLKYASHIERNCLVTIHHVGTELNHKLPLIVKKSTLICTTNSQAGAILNKFTGSGVPLTRYGVDTEFFRPIANGRQFLLSKLPNVNPETALLGLAAKPTSNEDDRKGFDRYWEVLRKLSSIPEMRPFRLVIFGPGPENPKGWKEESIPEDIRRYVVIVGYTERPELPALYSGLDFYLCLSRLEGGPYPVLECMACKTPVISTSVGSVSGLIVDGESGWIVDESNFLDRIPTLIYKPKNHMVEVARECVVEKHAFEHAYSPELYSQLYSAILAKKPSLLNRIKRFFF